LNLMSLPPLLMAAVCSYVGVYYGWMYFRRREDRENFSFAMTCFSIALYDLFCAGLYSASGIEEGMFWQRLQFASLALFSIAIAWFIFHYTRRPDRKPLAAISAWMGLFFAAGLLTRGELTLSLTRPHVKHTGLGGLVSITYYEADPGLLYDIQYISMILMSVYLLKVIADYYRGGSRRQARPLLVSVLIFFAAALNDTFVGTGIYRFIFLVEYAYMVIILSMAYVLLNRFIDLHHEVGVLNRRLEEKVKERTMELFFSEAGARMYREMLTGIPRRKSAGKGSAAKSAAGPGAAGSVEALSRETGVIADLDGLLRRTLLKAMEIARAGGGCVFLMEPGPPPEQRACAGEMDPALREMLARHAVRAAESRKARVLKQLPARSGAGAAFVPIVSRDRVPAVLCLTGAGRAGLFSERTLGMLTAFLAHLSVALENALLYRKIRAGEGASRTAHLTRTVEEKMRKVRGFIDENFRSDISREGLAALVEMHPDSLGRFFKKHSGRKIGDYINALRVREAARMLREGDGSIVGIAFAVGFESLATFNRVFLKEMKVSPSAWRAGGGHSGHAE